MAKEEASPEQKKTQLFSLRLPLRLWAELGVVARLRGVPLNKMLVDWLQAEWDRQPENATVARLVKSSGTAKPSDRGKAGDSK